MIRVKMQGGSLTRYMPSQVGEGLWRTLLDVGASAMVKGLDVLTQGHGLRAASHVVLHTGAKGIKRKASYSAKSAMQKVVKRARTVVASKVHQTTNRMRDILSE